MVEMVVMAPAQMALVVVVEEEEEAVGRLGGESEAA